MTYEPRIYWPERAERQGPSYVGPGGHPDKSAAERERITPYVRELVPRGGRLLDFGCGPGRLASELATSATRYAGCDIVDQDERDFPSGAVFHYLNSDRIPGGDARFDVVFCGLVLQHITDPDDFAHWCGEIGRVLKPGGTLVVWDQRPGGNLGEHMRPRGPEAVADAVGTDPFGHVQGAGPHWIGRATKPRPHVTVVAYYTEGTAYADEAALLEASLNRVGMRYELTPVADGGSWNANTAHKATFLSLVRNRLSGPLLYIDVDAFVHENCNDYFLTLSEDGIDFGAHWFAGPAKGHNFKRDNCACLSGGPCDQPHRLLSGTLFLGDTDGARWLLDTWVAMNKTLQNRGFPSGGGQKNLWFLLKGHFKDRLNTADLPGRYTYVFDKPEGYPGGEPCIIEHTIASRDHRAEERPTMARGARIVQLREKLERSVPKALSSKGEGDVQN